MKANEVVPGIYVDDRDSSYVWLINSHVPASDSPYAVCVGYKVDQLHVVTYTPIEFNDINKDITFKKVL